MPKKIVKDVGIMQREILQYELHELGALEAWAKAWDEIISNAKPDDLPGDSDDRDNAARCREILAKVGLADLMDNKRAVDLRPLIKKKMAENSAPYLAAHWLGAYHRMMAQRQRLLSDGPDGETIGVMLMNAQEMGRLHEAFRWRVDVDPQTGKRPEELAIGKRKQEKAIPKATQARRIQAQDTKPDWHDDATFDARLIRQKHPSYSRWRIAGEIHEKYGVSRSWCDTILSSNGIE
jgi:hypothetical protein